MKKVAHFIDSNDPGGAETLVIEICKNIGRYGFVPEIYHFGNPWLQERCKEFGIPSVIIPGYKYFKSIRTIPIFSVIFAQLLKRNKVDILHSHLFGSITGACIATYLTNTPHIGTLHDVYTLEEREKRILFLKLATILGVRLVAVSQHMLIYLEKKGRFKSGTLKTIVNGVDVEKFNVPVNKDLYLELNLTPDDIVFICVGRLERIKGQDILIDAFSKLKLEYNVKLLIVGDGTYRRYIEERIAEKGLSNYIKVLGHRNDIPSLLKISHCFVLSSRSEGLSCSIIEAMASGLPIIATDVGGNNELVRERENGYLVSSEDPAAFAVRLQELIDDTAKRNEFGKASLKLVNEKFSFNMMLEQYINNYNELIRSI